MSDHAEVHPDEDTRRFLDRITALLVVWTPRDGAVFVNRAWRELTGTGLDANVGAGWLRCVHGDDRSALGAALGNGGRPPTLEYRLLDREGNTVPVVDCVHAWDGGNDDGEGVVHTITPRATLDDPRQARLMSAWAHELRGPLNAILGWADLLSMGETRPEVVQRGLEAIAKNARQQALIIKRMTQ